MKHKIFWATWKSASSLEKTILQNEPDGWSVAGMGEVFGGSILILVNDGKAYRHKILQVFWSLKDRLTEIVEQEQEEGESLRGRRSKLRGWEQAVKGSRAGSDGSGSSEK